MSILHVWMNGLRVGTWSQPRSGAASFQYDDTWTTSAAARVLSLSLPFTPSNVPHRGEVVTSFFDNLLPDSDSIRSRLRRRFGTQDESAFALLEAIGRDCVGAIQLLPDGQSPTGYKRIDATALDDAEVERIIGASLSDGKFLGQTDEEEFRISLAGAQEKTALLWHNDRWCKPHGSTPTTHILKLPLGLVGNLQADMQDSVENEWLCSRLLAAFGLPVAKSEIRQFGRHKVLAVERFDRAWQDDRWIARLPQEDFCQALGVPPQLKYEADGGPGMADILRVLATSVDAAADCRRFVKTQIVFWLLAATDGHAKNFSLFHERGGGYRMTPLYDVLSAWPIIGNRPRQLPWPKARLAMSVRSRNAHWKLKDIQSRHWDGVAKQAGVGDAAELIAEVISQTPQAVEQAASVVPPGFPTKVADAIFEGVRIQAKRLDTTIGH